MAEFRTVNPPGGTDYEELFVFEEPAAEATFSLARFTTKNWNTQVPLDYSADHQVCIMQKVGTLQRGQLRQKALRLLANDVPDFEPIVSCPIQPMKRSPKRGACNERENSLTRIVFAARKHDPGNFQCFGQKKQAGLSSWLSHRLCVET